jgi:hypothetical protein
MLTLFGLFITAFWWIMLNKATLKKYTHIIKRK